MKEVRDTFLKFLADNLPDTVPVHAVRRDPSDPDSDKFKLNAVNVAFLDLTLDSTVSTQTVSVDVVNTNELDALAALNQVWLLLSAAYYTPQLNYTDLTQSPTTTGTNIYWSKNSIKFKPVWSDFYYHYTCLLPIQFNPISYSVK